MADVMRWRYGETNPVVSKAIGSSTVIQIGDLVEMAADGTVTPASAHTWNTDLATTQNEFQDTFLGVAMQRSRSGDTDPIRVATSGVFEFDCASATFEIGALTGPAKQTGNALENQKVVALAGGSEAKAIGRVAKRIGTADTKVLVEIVSTIQRGGPQAKI